MTHSAFMSRDRLMTVQEVQSLLPFKISMRALRTKLRASGLIIEHRRQIALLESDYPYFLSTLKCPSKSKLCNYADPITSPDTPTSSSWAVRGQGHRPSP